MGTLDKLRGFASRAAAQKATHTLKFKGGKIKPYTYRRSIRFILHTRMQTMHTMMGLHEGMSMSFSMQMQIPQAAVQSPA